MLAETLNRQQNSIIWISKLNLITISLRMFVQCIKLSLNLENALVFVIPGTVVMTLTIIISILKKEYLKYIWLFNLIIFFICSIQFLKQLTIIDNDLINFWLYESLISNLVHLMSFNYLFLQRIIMHCSYFKLIQQEYDQLDYVQLIILVICMIQDLFFKSKIFNLQKKQQEFYLMCSQFLMNDCPESFITIQKNDKNEFIITESNQLTLNNYQKLKDFFQKVKPIFSQKLPLNAENIIDLIDKLYSQKSDQEEAFQLSSHISRQNNKHSKIQIILKKYVINQQATIVMRIQDDTIEIQNEIIKIQLQTIESINHDIKNPLICGLTVAQQMKADYLEKQLVEFQHIQTMNYYFAVSLNSINNFLDFSKINRGFQFNENYEYFNFNQSVMRVYNTLACHAVQKDIQINVQWNSQNTFCLNNEIRFQQVLTNLIENSINITQKGGNINISIQEMHEFNLICIMVKDTSAGLNSQQLTNLFNPYMKESQNQYQSSGIQLFISKEITIHIGPCKRVFVQSIEGEGCIYSFLMYINAQNKDIQKDMQILNDDQEKIFDFLKINERQQFQLQESDKFYKLKRIKQQRHKSASIQQEQDQNQKRIKQQRHISASIQQEQDQNQTFLSQTNIKDDQLTLNILIVEDDLLMRKILVGHLRKSNNFRINITEAENGQQGLELVKKYNKTKNFSNFHIIFTDIQMPIMNGYLMAQHINQLIQELNYQRPEIVAISSDESQEYDFNCKNVQIDQNYTKPIKCDKIREIIQNYTSKLIQ